MPIKKIAVEEAFTFDRLADSQHAMEAAMNPAWAEYVGERIADLVDLRLREMCWTTERHYRRRSSSGSATSMARSTTVDPMTDAPAPADHDDAGGGTRRTYFGRNGSPEVTVAFPFSKVEVSRNDDEARAAALAALEAIASVAEMVEALAGAANAADRQRVGRDAQQLRADLNEIVASLSAHGDD